MDSKTKQQTVQMGMGKITVSEITMCGVFAALTFLLTRYIQVQIIPAKGGLVHLGNVPMFFAAAFFGKRVGAILRWRWHGIIGCTFSMDCICSGNFDCSWSDGLCLWFDCKEKTNDC